MVYGAIREIERKLWREDELSLTMWVGKNQRLPSAYESSSSSSSSRPLG